MGSKNGNWYALTLNTSYASDTADRCAILSHGIVSNSPYPRTVDVVVNNEMVDRKAGLIYRSDPILKSHCCLGRVDLIEDSLWLSPLDE